MDPVLLIFVALALFVIFKLISVLGTRTGHEQQHDLEGLQRARQADDGLNANASDDEMLDEPRVVERPVSDEAVALKTADPSFDEPSFIDGAKAAYEMIVEAFASGDLKSVRGFLDGSVYEAFKGAVVQREDAGHTVDMKFVGIDEARIVSSTVEDGQMKATIDFTSNQVRTVYDQEGKVVDGDPNRIDLVKDRWSFARKVGASDPNWVLIGAAGAQA